MLRNPVLDGWFLKSPVKGSVAFGLGLGYLAVGVASLVPGPYRPSTVILPDFGRTCARPIFWSAPSRSLRRAALSCAGGLARVRPCGLCRSARDLPGPHPGSRRLCRGLFGEHDGRRHRHFHCYVFTSPTAVGAETGAETYSSPLAAPPRRTLCIRRHERAIGIGQALAEADPRLPAEPAQLFPAHELAWRAVRPARVGDDFPVEADDLRHKVRELLDGDVLPGADVDVLVLRVRLHDEEERIGAVVDVQEFPPRRPGAPNDQLSGARSLGLMRLAEERRDDMARLEIVVVAGPVEVGWHRRNEIAPVLAAIGLAQLDAGDLGDRVPLVGRLEGA